MSDLKPGVKKVIREAVSRADSVWVDGPHEQVLAFLDHVCTNYDAGPQVNELRDAVKEIYYGNEDDQGNRDLREGHSQGQASV